MITIVILPIYATSPSPSPKPDPTRQIVGTWLYLWWHGPASIGKADGKTISSLMFIPESYGEATDQKSESFICFRARRHRDYV